MIPVGRYCSKLLITTKKEQPYSACFAMTRLSLVLNTQFSEHMLNNSFYLTTNNFAEKTEHRNAVTMVQVVSSWYKLLIATKKYRSYNTRIVTALLYMILPNFAGMQSYNENIKHYVHYNNQCELFTMINVGFSKCSGCSGAIRLSLRGSPTRSFPYGKFLCVYSGLDFPPHQLPQRLWLPKRCCGIVRKASASPDGLCSFCLRA